MLNKIMIIGNVGTDPEMRYTPSGAPVTSFRIATSRSYTGQDGERKQETEWFTVVAWGRRDGGGLAEQVNQYLAKGRKVYVEGRLHSHSYTGQDGQTRFRNEIIAERALFIDRPGDGDEYAAGAAGGYGGGYRQSGGDYSPPSDAQSPDDLPF